ncbi:MAG: hypothetical protein JSW11_19590 [Candidatus Heimdallarchaeota archaeon]|nr:MAG: hypothetical protein JSW11_19590 [Candidatus Heimdallarchaeota archaeon]
MNKRQIRETVTFSCESGFKDLLIKKGNELGYQNTSQMIRDALQNFFESEEMFDKISDSNTEITAIISVVYDQHDQKTMKKFIEVQHHFNVTFSTHYHMDTDECLENLIINDKIENVRSFLTQLRSIEGLRYTSIKFVSRTEYQEKKNMRIKKKGGKRSGLIPSSEIHQDKT